MFKNFLIFIPLFFATFFGNKMTPYEKNDAYMNGIVKISIKQLKDRYGLIPIGIGGSEKEGKSKMEFVSFQIHKKLTKEEGRILIVEIVELFLKNINSDTKIAHFLYNKPFTHKNLEFTIFIYDKDGSDVYHPDLGLVSLTPQGTVNFVTYQPGTKAGYASEIEEPYEEAYRIATQR